VKLAQELARRQLLRPLRERDLLTASSQVDAYLRATMSRITQSRWPLVQMYAFRSAMIFCSSG
jgi:hypothetical protein